MRCRSGSTALILTLLTASLFVCVVADNQGDTRKLLMRRNKNKSGRKEKDTRETEVEVARDGSYGSVSAGGSSGSGSVSTKVSLDLNGPNSSASALVNTPSGGLLTLLNDPRRRGATGFVTAQPGGPVTTQAITSGSGPNSKPLRGGGGRRNRGNRTQRITDSADDEEEEDDDEASRRSSRSTTITTLPTATFLSVSDDSNESIAEILQRVSQLGPTRFRG